MDNDERRRRVAETAYFRAQQRGFSGGQELEDWLEAEKELNGALAPFPDAMPNDGPGKEAASSKAKEEPVAPPSS